MDEHEKTDNDAMIWAAALIEALEEVDDGAYLSLQDEVTRSSTIDGHFDLIKVKEIMDRKLRERSRP